MIFIPIDLVLNTFAGNPGKLTLKSAFESVTPKTLENWVSGRHRLSALSKEKMDEELAKSVNSTVRATFWDQLFMQFDEMPESLTEAPWHAVLSSFEQGFLLSMLKGEAERETSLLLKHSMAELQVLEVQMEALSDLLAADEFACAIEFVRDELSECVLFNPLLYGTQWPAKVDSLQELKQYMWGARFNSLLYLVTLLDCSLTRDADQLKPEPGFEYFMPRLEKNKWVLPLQIWFDELCEQSGMESYSDLARALTDATEWGTVQQNIYRWRRGKPFPPWEEIGAKLQHLENKGALTGDQSFLLLLSFGLARTLHAFHFYLLKNGFSGEPLDRMYDSYGSWYRHHYKLNTPSE